MNINLLGRQKFSSYVRGVAVDIALEKAGFMSKIKCLQFFNKN